jgi:hypothetical protein
LLDNRQSFSYDDKPDVDLSAWTMPPPPAIQQYVMPLTQLRASPPLQLQTQGLGRAMRPRSSSRAMPYQRERSMSLSETTEADEDITALLSSTSARSARSGSGVFGSLAGPMDRMSLHHRRTSSGQVASPLRPSLTRAHRSASLALSKRSSTDAFVEVNTHLSGTAEERERMARGRLVNKAEEVKGAAGANQDKLRNLWVRCW